jgi:hypothetical protein
MGRKGTMSQPGFDQKLFDTLMHEADADLYYRINGLDPHRLYRLDMTTIRHNMAAMAGRVCQHREPIKELFEAGNVAGAFGLLSGAVHGMQMVGIMALTVYLSRHGVETFCRQYHLRSLGQ